MNKKIVQSVFTGSFFAALVFVLSAAFLPAQLHAETDEYLAFEFTGSLTGRYAEPLMEGQADPKKFYDEIRGAMDYRSTHFDLLIDWAMIADGKYSEEEPYMGGRYLYMYDTHVNIDLAPFSLKAGRGPHKDIVDSPYSVFINSTDIPAVHLELNYNNDFFFYTSRWIQLNYNSSQYYYGFSPEEIPSDPGGYDDPYASPAPGTAGVTNYLDKGANYKVFGVNLGDWRVGFQDVVIYLDRPFDPEYFLNPMPQYFVQLITTEEGRPWSQQGNTKSMMGFFADRSRQGSYYAGQILIDDINGDFIPGYEITPAIKTKMAWSLGGFNDFSFGRVGFFHGGATKYSFEATSTAHHTDRWGEPGFIEIPYSILPYDANYTPATEFSLKGGGQAPIHYTDNYLSYKYGENNLAFMVDYQQQFLPRTPLEFGLYSSFEYVLNGAKSPANPWHEYYSGSQTDEKIALLNGPVEHLFKLSTAVRKPVSDSFTLNLDLVAGVALNAIKLVYVPAVYSDEIDASSDDWPEPKIYVPQLGEHEPIFKLTIGGTYHLRLK